MGLMVFEIMMKIILAGNSNSCLSGLNTFVPFCKKVGMGIWKDFGVKKGFPEGQQKLRL